MSTIAARIAGYQQSADVTARAAEFLQIARALLATGNRVEAQQFLRKVATDRAREAFEQRAIVQPALSTDSTWAGPLAVYQLSDSFAETLRNASAFDFVLADGGFLRVPPLRTIAISTFGATATIVGETGPKAASLMNFTSASVVISKVQNFVVVSAELMKMGGPGPMAMLGRELRGAIGVGTDNFFLQNLLIGLTAIPSTGNNALAIRADVRDLMDAVSFGANARLYYVAPPQIAKRLAVVGDSTGGKMFPGLTPTGGMLDGVPLLVSDAAAAGTLTLFDATQVAVSAGLIELDRSDVAMLNLDSAPDSPPVAGTSYVNLYTQNMSALRSERFMGVSRLRTTAAAFISGFVGVGSSPS